MLRVDRVGETALIIDLDPNGGTLTLRFPVNDTQASEWATNAFLIHGGAIESAELLRTLAAGTADDTEGARTVTVPGLDPGHYLACVGSVSTYGALAAGDHARSTCADGVLLPRGQLTLDLRGAQPTD